MFEFEIGFFFFIFGIFFDRILFPRILLPYIRAHVKPKESKSHYHGRPKGAKNKPKVKEVETK